MGRKAGGKNFGNFSEEEKLPIEVPETEKKALSDIFTCINKDFITLRDLQESSGLSYDTCAKIIRQIKAVSDLFGISGCIHRTDYFMYISRQYVVRSMATQTLQGG